MVTLVKSTLLSNVWETIYDRIVSQVTTVTTAASVVYTVQTWTSSFPDTLIDDKDAYPIIIVNPVETSWDPHTFTKKHAMGEFQVEIYVTNSEAADLFIDKIINAIETYRNTLAGLGMEFVDLDSTDSDSVQRGSFKVHIRRAKFSFRFPFTKTAP